MRIGPVLPESPEAVRERMAARRMLTAAGRANGRVHMGATEDMRARHMLFLICRSAAFSKRDTCAWEMPISSATSIWVRP